LKYCKVPKSLDPTIHILYTAIFFTSASLSLSFSLSRCLFLLPCLYLYVYLFLPFCLFVSFCLVVSFSLFVSFCLFLSLSVSLSLSGSLSLFFCLFVSFCLRLSLPFTICSLDPFFILSYHLSAPVSTFSHLSHSPHLILPLSPSAPNFFRLSLSFHPLLRYSYHHPLYLMFAEQKEVN
jgi:hypothetical protein